MSNRRPQGPFAAGVDLGGTKILTIVTDADDRIIAHDRRETEAERGPDAVIDRIRDSISAALRAAGIGVADLDGIGMAVPGPIDLRRGVVTNPPNLPGWRDVPVGDLIRETFDVPVVLENDANAAAVGEFVYGAGRDARHMIYMTISTGVGGGFILGGRLYHGADGTAGEIGHMVLESDGPLCGCGQRGHVEALISGTAIARDGRALVEAGRAPVLARLAREQGDLTAETVEEAVAAGDPDATALLDRVIYYLGRTLISLTNIFNPHAIIIGGGVSRMGARLLDPAAQAVREGAFPVPATTVRILRAELGGRSGALGAVALLRGRLD